MLLLIIIFKVISVQNIIYMFLNYIVLITMINIKLLLIIINIKNLVEVTNVHISYMIHQFVKLLYIILQVFLS